MEKNCCKQRNIEMVILEKGDGRYHCLIAE